MNAPQVHVPGSIYSRILWLYGIYTLLSNAAFLIGYYWLPEGFMRASPQTAGGQVVLAEQTFWGQFGLTLLLNLGVTAVVSIVLNFNQIKGLPAGYLYPLFLAVSGGLIAGTNSFLASDLTQYTVYEGHALSLSIGGLESLGFIFIVAATVRFGVYQYRSWWRWSGEWRPVKVMNFRDVRLSMPEIACLVTGILLVILAAYRETLLGFNML
jgi:hypothetical protein